MRARPRARESPPDGPARTACRVARVALTAEPGGERALGHAGLLARVPDAVGSKVRCQRGGTVLGRPAPGVRSDSGGRGNGDLIHGCMDTVRERSPARTVR